MNNQLLTLVKEKDDNCIELISSEFFDGYSIDVTREDFTKEYKAFAKYIEYDDDFYQFVCSLENSFYTIDGRKDTYDVSLRDIIIKDGDIFGVKTGNYNEVLSFRNKEHWPSVHYDVGPYYSLLRKKLNYKGKIAVLNYKSDIMYYASTDINSEMPCFVTTIAPFAFSSDYFLSPPQIENIFIPDTVKEIGVGIFSGCKTLKDIRLPNGLEVIPEGAFLECESLKKIKIPDSVKRIDAFAFSRCSSLKKIVFPVSLKSIDEDAFYNGPLVVTAPHPSHETVLYE